jgi:lipoyl(octanoyl) transferase
MLGAQIVPSVGHYHEAHTEVGMETINLVGQGLVSYADGLALQADIHAEVAPGNRPNTMIVLEHESVYTGGKMSELSDIRDPSIEVVDTNRGGKITWHGPGQLVGYPIYRLPNPIDVVGYVRTLEEMIIDVIGSYGVIGHRVPKRTGVWVGPEGAMQKIAAIGIRISDRTAMHGFALNVNNSLDPFRAIIACGIADAGATTLEIEGATGVTVAQVASDIATASGRFFP